MVHHWTMRYEAKHKYFASNIGNFINISHTLALRHQLLQCYLHLDKCTTYLQPEYTKGTFSCALNRIPIIGTVNNSCLIGFLISQMRASSFCSREKKQTCLIRLVGQNICIIQKPKICAQCKCTLDNRVEPQINRHVWN